MVERSFVPPHWGSIVLGIGKPRAMPGGYLRSPHWGLRKATPWLLPLREACS